MTEDNEYTAPEKNGGPVGPEEGLEGTAPTGGETQEAVKKKGNPVSRFLDNYFHITERGSTIGNEVLAGISTFLISLCVLLFQTNLMSSAFASDPAAANLTYGTYCAFYFAGTLVTFIGTILMGLVFRLPLVQTVSLGMSSALISLLGVGTGLTYANLMAVTFFSAVVYLAIVLTPAWKFVMKAMPRSVLKALPAATGLLIVFMALDNLGIITISSDGGMFPIAAADFGGFDAYTVIVLVGALVGVVSYFLYRRLKVKHSLLCAFLTGWFVFFIVVLINPSTRGSISSASADGWISSSSRFSFFIGMDDVTGGGAYTVSLAGADWASFNLASMFTSGFDFSSYTGNTFTLFAGGILIFLVYGMYGSLGNVRAAGLLGNMLERDGSVKGERGAFICNAAMNVVAPVLGSAPLSVSAYSSVNTSDNGKTGLSTVVCSIGFLISLFTWVFFGIFATTVVSAPAMSYGKYVFAQQVQASFQIADAVMLIVGFLLLGTMKDCEWGDLTESIPFLATIVATLFTMNLSIGIAIGVIAYAVVKLCFLRVRDIGVCTAVAALLMLLMLIFI